MFVLESVSFCCRRRRIIGVCMDVTVVASYVHVFHFPIVYWPIIQSLSQGFRAMGGGNCNLST